MRATIPFRLSFNRARRVFQITLKIVTVKVERLREAWFRSFRLLSKMVPTDKGRLHVWKQGYVCEIRMSRRLCLCFGGRDSFDNNGFRLDLSFRYVILSNPSLYPNFSCFSCILLKDPKTLPSSCASLCVDRFFKFQL